MGGLKRHCEFCGNHMNPNSRSRILMKGVHRRTIYFHNWCFLSALNGCEAQKILFPNRMGRFPKE